MVNNVNNFGQATNSDLSHGSGQICYLMLPSLYFYLKRNNKDATHNPNISLHRTYIDK
jgi:hypothetical protein